MTEPVLTAVGISKRFGHNTVVDKVSLTVDRGETVCILGPSGAGKSTFLRCLNLLEIPDEGLVFLSGEVVGYRVEGDGVRLTNARSLALQRRRIGMVFQSFNLFPHMNVLQNVTEGPIKVLGIPKVKAREAGLALLAKVGLADKSSAFPDELSGGQQQRVAIARALAMDPELILFDEPTSALDPELVNDVLDVIRRLAEDGVTMIVVTHEIGFAREVAHRIVFMEAGAVIEEGPAADVLSNPTNPRTKEFLSKVL